MLTPPVSPVPPLAGAPPVLGIVSVPSPHAVRRIDRQSSAKKIPSRLARLIVGKLLPGSRKKNS
jgi:hypothetical protein